MRRPDGSRGHGPSKDGRWQFFTGLIPTDRADWYFGIVRFERSGSKVNSLVIFQFSDNDRTLTLTYFPGWYIHHREERVKYVLAFAHRAEVTSCPPPHAIVALRPPINSNGGM